MVGLRLNLMPTAYAPAAGKIDNAPFPTEIVKSVFVKLIPTPENGVEVETPFLYEAMTDAVVTHVEGVNVKRLAS